MRSSQRQDLITDPGERLDALFESLAQHILAQAGLAEVVGEIAEGVGLELALTTTDGRERTATFSDATRAALADADLVDPTGRIRVEWLSGEGVRALPRGEVRRVPVAAPGQALGHLVAVANRPCDEADLRSLERCATAVALAITRDRAVAAVENKYRGDFLRDVLLGRAGSEDFCREHASGFGWELAGPMVVLSAQIDPPRPGEAATPEERRQWQERFAAAWGQVVVGIDRSLPVADFGSEVVVVLPGREPTEALVRRIVHAVAGDKGGGRRSFSVGVGRVAGSSAHLPESYHQARRAVEVGRRIHGDGSTTSFDQLGLHRLIAMIPDPAELRTFAHDVLGDLADDTAEAATLRETLQVLLDTNFNVAEAARTQFFHYNTMRYRVGKLERLIGPLSTDANLRLDTAVALKVLEILR